MYYCVCICIILLSETICTYMCVYICRRVEIGIKKSLKCQIELMEIIDK